MKLKVLPILFLASACQADPSDHTGVEWFQNGAPSTIRLFHVQGQHQCWSTQNIGYMCDVENNDSTDCTAGHSRNQMNDSCCKFFNGLAQENGKSISYMPGSCSPLW